MHKLLLTFTTATLLLTACEPRKNPLTEISQDELLGWITKQNSAEIPKCAKIWADPNTALDRDIKPCEKLAKTLTDEMNYIGLTQNAVPEDLYVPKLWRTYIEKQEEKERLLKEIKDIQNDPNDPANLFGK